MVGGWLYAMLVILTDMIEDYQSCLAHYPT